MFDRYPSDVIGAAVPVVSQIAYPLIPPAYIGFQQAPCIAVDLELAAASAIIPELIKALIILNLEIIYETCLCQLSSPDFEVNNFEVRLRS